MIWYTHQFASSHRCLQGSSYEAPGAAALNHCLKPPAQARRNGAKNGRLFEALNMLVCLENMVIYLEKKRDFLIFHDHILEINDDT